MERLLILWEGEELTQVATVFCAELHCNSVLMNVYYFSVSIVDVLLLKTLMIYLIVEEFNVSLA
jgi:hypothetical protein